MTGQSTKQASQVRRCPSCGDSHPLYRTPRGLRCETCIKTEDSGGFDFRDPPRRPSAGTREPARRG